MEEGPESLEQYRQPTSFVDSDTPEVIEFANRTVGDASTDVDKAVRLYYAVRDGLWYNPYDVVGERDDLRASVITGKKSAFCVQKATLLAAAARAVGIPARLGYADVRNHLASAKLLEAMGTDLFIYHGYTELYLEGKWVKATPTFNKELCERFEVKPLEFDGHSDALFHEFDHEGRRHMEYIRDRGVYADLPYDEMLEAFHEIYGGTFGLFASSSEDPVFNPPTE